MAMGSIVNAMRTAKVISDAQYNAISDALNGAYDATAKDEAYKPTQFVDALRKVARQFQNSRQRALCYRARAA